MAELLDGVSEIDWSALDHAYGSAEDVPRWLAAMTDPATSGGALGDLDAAVYHQGGEVYSAGAAVVPFLIRFATDPAVPGRPDILDLLSCFAALHNEMREPWKSEPAAQTCRAALLAAFDRLVGLLDEPDPAIRHSVVEVLVELGERAHDVVHELIRRIPGEADPADYVLALGTVGGSVAAAWLADNTPPPGDPRRLTYLVAARRISRAAARAEELVAAYANASPERTVNWLGREIGFDRVPRTALARTAIGQAVRTREPGELAEVGAVMLRWRSATAELAPDLAAALDGPPAIHAAVLHLLAATGDAGRPWSDAVATLIDEPGRTGTMAAWALARWGDSRAVPVVARSLRRDPEVFRMGSTHYPEDFYWLDGDDPSAADVCLPMAAHAAELVPAIRWRLRNDGATPTAYHLTQVLSAFEAAALPALPELTRMLGSDHPQLACTVLGGLGPAAADARPALTAVARSDGRGAAAAAWALFRITGDPDPFLAHEGLLDTERHSGQAVRQLGDLGPLAARYAPGIERRLAADPQQHPTWNSVELGFAHYRITGDPTLCLDVLGAALESLRHDRQLPVSRRALQCLSSIGRAAAGFAPLLREAVEQDERFIHSGGWRGIAEDDEARGLATAALSAVTT
ncbi:hypothetical protein SAMN05421812_107258 [Asanoa hainanensis]|uniref:HEAT repeat-containing protein n=1 Tax=Asanoa hainanensis TaxID=560556 RepID=A0A239N6S7_9ACTN|nr:hypothetical protein [Asanoa hainanensis]SNT49879.1 hypothetical protein SAMN05421812_107258 [Asanoa hainanensis]